MMYGAVNGIVWFVFFGFCFVIFYNPSLVCERSESEGGYVENLKTGVKTSMRKAGKGYKLDLWVKARNKEDELMEITGGASGENKSEGFKWQGTP